MYMVRRSFLVPLNVEKQGSINGGLRRVEHEVKVECGAGTKESAQNEWEPKAR